MSSPGWRRVDDFKIAPEKIERFKDKVNYINAFSEAILGDESQAVRPDRDATYTLEPLQKGIFSFEGNYTARSSRPPHQGACQEIALTGGVIKRSFIYHNPLGEEADPGVSFSNRLISSLTLFQKSTLWDTNPGSQNSIR